MGVAREAKTRTIKMLKPMQQSQSTQFKPDDAFASACKKCSNRNICKRPCFFIEKYLSFENVKPFEEFKNDVLIVRPERWRIKRESEFPIYANGKPSGEKMRAFSTENPSPFLSGINTTAKQTAVFVDRFFNRMDFKEIAQKYDMAVTAVESAYKKAKIRIINVVGAQNRVRIAKKNTEKLVYMPVGVRCFFLYVTFGLTAMEISNLLEVGYAYVSNAIKYVRDQVICGEIDLISYTVNDQAAAQARIEKARAIKKRCVRRQHNERKKREQKARKPIDGVTELMSLSYYAENKRVNYKKLYQWASRGKLKGACFRSGAHLYIDPVAADALLGIVGNPEKGVTAIDN